MSVNGATNVDASGTPDISLAESAPQTILYGTTVTTRPDPPDTGAPTSPPIPLAGGLLLIGLGLILVATSRRRRRRGVAA